MADIYAVGDGQFLADVINSLALITQSSSFIGLSLVGFTLGILWVGVQSVMSGGTEFKIQNILIAFLTWMVLFGSSTDVIVTDIKSSQTRVVSNVPSGIAYTGQIISTLGYRVTELFEQGFSTVGMLDNGFAKDLKVVRTLDTLTLGAANTNNNGTGDRIGSINNYLSDCTLEAIKANQTSASTLSQSSNLLNAIQFNSINHETSLKLPSQPDPTQFITINCKDGFTALKNDLTGVGSAFPQKIFEQIGGLIGEDDSASYIQDLLNRNGLAQLNATPIQYVNNSIIKNQLPQAIATKTVLEYGDDRYAIMLKQANDQRQAQWSAERDTFSMLARPLMTFFEAAMYAIAPLLAFVVALGPAGFGMAGQYLKFALWIQMWLPVMAIVNFYTVSSFEGRMDSLINDQSINAMSLDGLFTLNEVAANWFQTGSMLIAMTPFITLMLLYGGVQAAASLAGQLKGQDHINEKIASPDLYQPSALVKDANNQVTINDPANGDAGTGTSGLSGTTGIASQLSNTSASSTNLKNGINEQFASRVQSGVKQEYGSLESNLASDSLKQSTGGKISESSQVLIGAGQKSTSGFQATDSQRNSAAVLFGASVAGTLGGSSKEEISPEEMVAGKQNLFDGLTSNGLLKSPVTIGASGRATSASATEQAMVSQISDSFDQAVSTGSDTRVSLDKAINSDRTASSENRTSNLYSASNGESYDKAFSSARTQEQTYSQQAQYGQTQSSGHNLTNQSIAAAVSKRPEQIQSQGDYIDNVGGQNGRYNDNLNSLSKNSQYSSLPYVNGQPSPQLKAAAQLSTIQQILDDPATASLPNASAIYSQGHSQIVNALETASGVPLSSSISGFNTGYNDFSPSNPNTGLTPPSQSSAQVEQSVNAETLNPGNLNPLVPNQAYNDGKDNNQKLGLDSRTNTVPATSPEAFSSSGRQALVPKTVSALRSQQIESSSAKVDALPELSNTQLIADTASSLFSSLISFPQNIGTAINSATGMGESLGADAYQSALTHYHDTTQLPEPHAQAAAIMASGFVPEELRPEGYSPSFSTSLDPYSTGITNTGDTGDDYDIVRNLIGADLLDSARGEKLYDQFSYYVATSQDNQLEKVSDASPTLDTNHALHMVDNLNR